MSPDFFVDAIGAGTPILMMHGIGLDHTSLRPWHDSLASDARVIYYDHRGNGRSTRTGTLDHATWCADAVHVLDQIGEPRAIIFGHSYGAWLALAMAREYPDRVAGLILTGVSLAFDYVPDVIANAAARDPDAPGVLASAMSRPLDDDELRVMWQRILPIYFAGAAQPDVLAGVRYGGAAFSAGLAALAAFSVDADLPAMTMPMLILAGAHDYITPPAQAHRLAARAPNAQVVELARSGHFPFVEEHARYLGAIRDWLHVQRPAFGFP